MSQIDDFLDNINTGDHVILFYDREGRKHDIIYNYLAKGLVRGKGIAYVYTEESPQDIYKGLAKHGIDVEPNLSSGNIKTPRYDEFYIVKDEADTLRILRKWLDLSNYFLSKGLGMRVTGDTSCFFKKGKVRELLRYEYALKKVLALPMDAICAYSLNTIVETRYTDIIMPLIRAHGKAIFTSENGIMIMEPENIEESDIERLLDINI